MFLNTLDLEIRRNRKSSWADMLGNVFKWSDNKKFKSELVNDGRN